MKYEDIITKVKSYNWKKMSRFMKICIIIGVILALPIIVALAPFFLVGLVICYVSVIPRVAMKFKTIRTGCLTVVVAIVGYLIYKYQGAILLNLSSIGLEKATDIIKYGSIAGFVLAVLILVSIPVQAGLKSKERFNAIWTISFIILAVSLYFLHFVLKLI